uniref:Uncharacterized protein n=1 Tax=Parascaris equorum TaxID=6256 RepID=A0A914R8I6_PAREQ
MILDERFPSLSSRSSAIVSDLVFSSNTTLAACHQHVVSVKLYALCLAVKLKKRYYEALFSIAIMIFPLAKFTIVEERTSVTKDKANRTRCNVEAVNNKQYVSLYAHHQMVDLNRGFSRVTCFLFWHTQDQLLKGIKSFCTHSKRRYLDEHN